MKNFCQPQCSGRESPATVIHRRICFHVQCIHHLEPVDIGSQLEFCHQINSYPLMICNILFTDEAHFTHDGVNNTRNFHLWDHDNPHRIVKSNYQHRFSINMWCGVICYQLIGPYIFPWDLTGDIYANFLQDELPVILYKHDERCTTNMMEKSLISVRSSGYIWIINSQTDGSVVAVHWINHHGHFGIMHPRCCRPTASNIVGALYHKL